MATKKKPKPGMSQSAYAKHRGVSRQIISRQIKEGTITLDKNKRIDPLIADKERDANLNPLRGGAEGTRNIPTKLNDVRIRQVYFSAELARLHYEEQKGYLVKSKEVKSAAFSMARKVRDQMLNIPDRIAAVVAAESDSRTVRKIILEEIEKALESL